MDSLNFENVFNKEKGNVGDLFQSFVFELLRKSDYPKLHKFQTAGRDGGIDLIQQLNNERTVVECKYIGDNSINEAENRWKEVKKRLETHLVKLKPEKQYKPWLNSDTPITFYLFCVSSDIRNQAGFDDFEKEITDFFKNLAKSYSHLEHLKNIRTEIIDRSKLIEKLDDHLKFKWFPLPEKSGFIPIQKKSSKGSFRSFLEEDSLPFYNRSRHLEKHPNADIQSEEQLLETLENKHGIIITGSGGSGKTRLTLELGRLAYKKGWLVFRCNETVNVENLTELIRNTADNSKVLLLMDYVETQKHFTEIIENLEVINDYYNFQIKYVANCRTSFYPTIRDVIDHSPISLTSSPTSQSSDTLWLKEYQESVVQHILEKGGIEIEDKHLTVCKNSPILAVFLLYLHRKNRDEELENLLQEEDFGKWIQKRTKMSFVNVIDFEMKLAKLIAIFPFSEDIWSQLDDFNVKLLGILANDGWIEKFQESEWRSIHDVFADQIILSYVRDNPHFIEKFIRDIFSFSYLTDCLKSAIVSVQRLSPYLEVDFNKILNTEIDNELSQWKKIRNYLLETSLLQESQKLDLLAKEALWEDAETDVTFRTGLGTIIRRTVKNSDSLTEAQLSNAKSWLIKSLPFITSNNFLLVWALRFSPKEIKDLALDWVRSHSSDFHTQRVFQAWLDAHLPTSEIREFVWLWFDKHQTALEARFVYKSWLNARGEIEFVREPIKLWLDKHQTALEFVYKSWLDAEGEIEFVREPLEKWLVQHQTALDAQFIYKSWLDARGEIEFVREPIKLWLDKHQTALEAVFVYEAWLNARGEIEFVREPIKLWLDKHQTALEADFVMRAWLDASDDFSYIKEFAVNWLAEHFEKQEAVYLTKQLAKQSDLPIETVRHILLWCAKFYEEQDALWRLTHLKDKLNNNKISKELISASEKIIEFVLLKDKINYTSQGQFTATFFSLFLNKGLQDFDSIERIELMYLKWLKHPNAFGKGFNTYPVFQKTIFLEHFAVLLEKNLLNIDDDRISIERFLRHFNNWFPENRQMLQPIIQDLQSKYSSDLWEIVTFQ